MKKKKRFLALLMAVAMLVPTTAAFAADTSVAATSTKVQYTDVSPNAWYYEPVMKVTELGLMNGIGNNEFNPDGILSRAQFATVLWNMEGYPAVTYKNLFDDVKSNEWFTTPVEWAGQNGIISGTGYRTFAPGQAITREQIVTIFYRYANSKGYDVSKRANLSGFYDSWRISSWAVNSMQWAVANGIMAGAGDGTLNPLGQVTRAQCATLIANFLRFEESQKVKHVHTWDEGRIVIQATCTEPGKKLYTCTGKDCNETREEDIAALGHDVMEHVNEKAATCTEAGYTGDDVCERCGNVIKHGEVVPALGHHMVNDMETVTIGWYECKVCHAQFDNTTDCAYHCLMECDSTYTYKTKEITTIIGSHCINPGCNHKTK